MNEQNRTDEHKQELLDVHVLLQSSKKTGKISLTMTAMGKAMLQLWALENTASSKVSHIFNRRTGQCVMIVEGAKGFPNIEKHNLGKCDEYGIPFDALQDIKDKRFDK
jgi:hypothetical protein